MPAISVIIPVYEAAAFLRRCLDSLLAQTFADWEAVCIDDGSTDASAEILDDYAARDARFRVFHKANEGVSIARNAGIARAAGNYVLFCDSDDFLHPQTMEICFARAERDGADLVAFTYDRRFRTRQAVRQFLHCKESSGLPARFPRYEPEKIGCRVTDRIFDHATERSRPGRETGRKWAVKHCQPWRCLYRKSAVEHIPFIPGIIYEDFPWWSEVLLHIGRASILNLPLYYYTPNPRSYIFSAPQDYRIRSLETAIAAARQRYAAVEDPYIRARWEENFLQPFCEKLADKQRKSARQHRRRITLTRLRLLAGGHLFNPVLDGIERHRKRCEAFYGRVLTEYMRKYYLPAAGKVRIPETDAAAGEEVIWSVWLQGEEQAPPIVKSCFASIRANAGIPLVVLDEKSLTERIRLPDGIMEKYRSGQMRACHFTDICRVELLYRYGGYWLDATCFTTAPVPDFIRAQEFFMFMAGSRVHGSYSFVQNCFIRARKGSRLLAAWRAMILDYWLHEDRRVDYFQHQLMFRTLVTFQPEAKELFARMPQIDQYPTHLYLYEYENAPYDPEVFREAAREGFFYQKTTYRMKGETRPGSFREYLLGYRGDPV